MAKKTDTATEIGLAISERISDEGLDFIKMKDFDLYDRIMKVLDTK